MTSAATGSSSSPTTFAAAVLMPTTALESYDGWAQLEMEGLIAQLNHVADELGVTSSALRWRLEILLVRIDSVVQHVPNLRIEGPRREATRTGRHSVRRWSGTRVMRGTFLQLACQFDHRTGALRCRQTRLIPPVSAFGGRCVGRE